MSTETLILNTGTDDEIEIEIESESLDNENPNVDDQLAATTTDDEGIKLTAEERVKEYLEADEELKEYGDDVQRRINKLTYNWRESERREQAAVEYAQKVHTENDELRTQQQQQDGVFINEYKGRVEAQLETAKQQYKEAYEAGDPGLITEANGNIARYAAELNTAEQTEHRYKRNAQQPPPVRPQMQYPQAQPQAQPPMQQQPVYPQQQQPQPDAKAEGWAEKNKWFGEDRVMTTAAMGIHQDLVQNGYAPESDEYYNQINSQMRKNFPHKFTPPKQQVTQTVTPGATNAVVRKAGKKHVKLTASQVNIAKRLGVPLEEYAKYV